MPTPTTTRIRRQVLKKPGFTKLPRCPICGLEIPLIDYARHTRECKKAPPLPAPATQGTVERSPEIARRESLTMALLVDQLRQRFRIWGSGLVFLPHVRPHVADDHLRQACSELARMGNPAVWTAAGKLERSL